jgi:hypothetical protein
MTGYLLVHCGKCGAHNKVRSLREPPLCVECSLDISMSETGPTEATLLCDVDVGPLGVSLD